MTTQQRTGPGGPVRPSDCCGCAFTPANEVVGHMTWMEVVAKTDWLIQRHCSFPQVLINHVRRDVGGPHDAAY